jgi:colanic acid/amylovoran biosynthesis glycosyltransferase
MSFAYLLESFPDPTKTFVYREVAEAVRQGLEPLIYSIREPSAQERELYEGNSLPVIYLPPEPELRSYVEAQRASFSVRQRRELSKWRAVKGDSTRVFEALWLGRELRSRGVSHVHAHFAGIAARTAWLVRRLWGISYSFTGHADDVFSPEPREISLDRLVEGTRFVATETDYSRVRLENEFPAARGKMFRVFNGIDEESFGLKEKTAAAAAEPDAPPRIVSVGRLVEKKGFPTLLQACAELRQRGLKFALDIIGAGPMEEELRARIGDRALQSVASLHGAQPQSFVRERLTSARVFVLASQPEGDGGSDNLPTVIMEAMASRLPVVSTRVAGIPEMVDDGETGLLVPAGEPGLLAEALAAYLADPVRSAAHGAEGAKRARQKFAISASVSALARLLASQAAVRFPRIAVARDQKLRVPWFNRLRLWLLR